MEYGVHDSIMKKLEESFVEGLNLIMEQVKVSNYSGAETIATNLINISNHLDYPDGVLIGEILEAIFDQLMDTLSEYKIESGQQESLSNELLEGLEQLIKSIKTDDELSIYKVLRFLRTKVTSLQYQCWETARRVRRSYPRFSRLPLEME